MSSKVGRPAFKITEKIIKKAEKLAAGGRTQAQIASSLGIHIDTLCVKKNEYSEFSEAIKKGQAKSNATIENALYKSAKGGNVTAQIFYLKNRVKDDWKDRQEVEAKVDFSFSDILNSAIRRKRAISEKEIGYRDS